VNTRRGDARKGTKLTMAIAREIRRLRREERLPYSEIAARFNVTTGAAVHVGTGRTWVDASDSLPEKKVVRRGFNDMTSRQERLDWLLRPINRRPGFPTREAYSPDANGCWIWNGSLWKGYAHRSRVTVHLELYRVLRGAVPPGLDLDHLCRNRACINPDHLEPVTRGENLRRGRISRGLAA
jgi:hypothetical protein